MFKSSLVGLYGAGIDKRSECVWIYFVRTPVMIEPIEVGIHCSMQPLGLAYHFGLPWNAMARYFVDVHNTIDAKWDFDGTECADGAAIEAHARDAANRRVTDHDGGIAPIIVTVHDEDLTIVLTATIEDDGVRFDWGNSPKPGS